MVKPDAGPPSLVARSSARVSLVAQLPRRSSIGSFAAHRSARSSLVAQLSSSLVARCAQHSALGSLVVRRSVRSPVAPSRVLLTPRSPRASHVAHLAPRSSIASLLAPHSSRYSLLLRLPPNSSVAELLAPRSPNSSLLARFARKTSKWVLHIVSPEQNPWAAGEKERAPWGIFQIIRWPFIHLGNSSNSPLSIWQILQMASQEGPGHPPRAPTLPREDK